MSGREYWDQCEQWQQWERDTGAMDVIASELVITRASSAEVREYTPLASLLQRAHKAFGVEMVFISEWCGEPVVRPCDEAEALHAAYGRRVLESDEAGRRYRVDALPVDAGNGRVHGTVCFRLPFKQSLDAEVRGAVVSVARLIANWFEAATR